jgi:hypothetical protein
MRSALYLGTVRSLRRNCPVQHTGRGVNLGAGRGVYEAGMPET